MLGDGREGGSRMISSGGGSDGSSTMGIMVVLARMSFKRRVISEKAGRFAGSLHCNTCEPACYTLIREKDCELIPACRNQPVEVFRFPLGGRHRWTRVFLWERRNRQRKVYLGDVQSAHRRQSA